MDFDAEDRPNWLRFDQKKTDEGGLEVYEGKLKVVASERQNRLVVYEQE